MKIPGLQNSRVDLGTNTYAYFNADNSFVMQERYKEKHKSALLSGLFRCVYFNDPVKNVGPYIGWWCTIEIDGKHGSKLGERVYFREEDIINNIFQEYKENAEITHDTKKIEQFNKMFEQLEIAWRKLPSELQSTVDSTAFY